MFHGKFLVNALFFLTLFWLIVFSMFGFSKLSTPSMRGWAFLTTSYAAVMILSLVWYFFG